MRLSESAGGSASRFVALNVLSIAESRTMDI